MKKKYVEPEVSATELKLNDVIAVSNEDSSKDIFEFDDAFEDVFNI